MKEYFPKSELFEKLAAIEHERWSDWQRYCFEKLGINYQEKEYNILNNTEESDIERWWRQIKTEYKDLSEREKDSDREQVMRYWYLINTPTSVRNKM